MITEEKKLDEINNENMHYNGEDEDLRGNIR